MNRITQPNRGTKRHKNEKSGTKFRTFIEWRAE